VVGVDDDYGRRLASTAAGAVTFALESPADYRARDVRLSPEGAEFVAVTPEGEEVELHSPLRGRFNVANALGALAAAHRLGVPLATIAAALPGAEPVPGRFQPVDEGQPFAGQGDYAHTPDSLENVLGAARDLLARSADGGRLICVFGAGGDRDRGKRPLMGEIAARLADLVIVTSDNPRSEDPDAIIAEIMAGVPAAGGGPERGADVTTPGRRLAEVRTVPDRRAAIAEAVRQARRGDVVVIAGKGHEQGQELAGGVKVPFDDVTVASEALAERRAAPAATGARA
jgi:UDP-N-acetylmuramoyl-L-alanyl-D-glutamate--2,6-diaminopimelate ligase